MASDASAFVRRVLAHPSTPEGDDAARKDVTEALVGASVEFQTALYNTVGGLHRRMAALLRAVEGSLRDAAAAEGVRERPARPRRPRAVPRARRQVPGLEAGLL